MFWRMTTFTQLSPIEAILDKEDCTLEELLDEEDLIQECKAANPRLVPFLGRRNVIAQLIKFLAETPEDDVLFKYSYTACEIFCCELEEVLTTLIKDEELMTQLFSLLDRPPPLNSTIAGYFGRVVGSLLVKRPQDTHEYLEAHQEVLHRLVNHIDTTSTVEVILRLIGADDITSAAPNHTDWLANTDFMQQLLDRLCAPAAQTSRAAALQKATQQNIANILVAVAHSQSSPMVDQLTATAYLRKMLSHAAAPGSLVLQPVLLVCIALLDPKQNLQPMTAPIGFGMMPNYEAPPEPSRATIRAAAVEIVQFLPRFTALLDGPAEAGRDTQEQPYGTLKPPLGRQRLTLIEFGKALLTTEEPLAVRAVTESDFVPKVMQLFAQYPYNNILHGHVKEVIEKLLHVMGSAGPRQWDEAASPEDSPTANGVSGGPGDKRAGAPGTAPGAPGSDAGAEDMPDVLEFLLDKCNVPDWLMGLQTMVMPSSDRFTARRVRKEVPLYAAYHGHVTQLARSLESSPHGLLIAALSMNKEWQEFKSNVLEPRLDAEDEKKWSVALPVDQMSEGPDVGEVYPPDMFGTSPSFGLNTPDPFGQPASGRYADDDDEQDYHDDDDDDDDDDEDGLVSATRSHPIDEVQDSDDSDGSDEDRSAVVQPAADPAADRAVAELTDATMRLDVDAPTIDEDDEVELGTGSPDREPPGAGAAEVEEEDRGGGMDHDMAEGHVVAAEEVRDELGPGAGGQGAHEGLGNWWKLPGPELSEADLPPPSARADAASTS